MSSCNPNPYLLSQSGRLLYPGNEDVKQGPERPQRLSRVNRSTLRLAFGAAVTDAPNMGCQPPVLDTDRILGFTLQITPADVNPGEVWQPDDYLPGDIVNVTLNDRIKAVAPCDVYPGDPVFVEPGTGLPVETGLLAPGCTWETKTMAGGLAVIQVNTRPQWGQYRGTFPPAGIAVSGGDAWIASIDPAVVAYRTTANLFTGDQTIEGSLIVTANLQALMATFATCDVDGSPVRTFDNTPDPAPPAPQVYPPAGIAVSDGSAWAAPIDPARLSYLDTANTFTQNQHVNAALLVTGPAILEANLNVTEDAYIGNGLVVSGTSPTIINTPLQVEGDATFANLTVGNTLTLGGDPVQSLEAATKQYVDAQTAGGGMVYPAAGIPRSTGTGWGAAIATIDASSNASFVSDVIAAARVKAYGWDGSPTDVTRPHVMMGTGTSGVNPILSLINASAPTGMRVWSIIAHTTQLLFTADNDAGSNWYWMIVNRPAAGNPTNVEFPFPLLCDSTLTLAADPTAPLQAATKQYVDAHAGGGSMTYPAAGLALSTGAAWGTSIDPATLAYKNAANTFTVVDVSRLRVGSNATAYQLDIRDPGQNQAYIGTTDNSNYAVLRFGTPTQVWQFGVGGSNSVYPGIWYVFDQNAGKAQMQISPGTGNALFLGSVTAATKNFRIPYPGEERKLHTLNHSCLEGPEIAVFYRGEVQTANGSAEVMLPEYFEALTSWEGRSVLLTQVYDDDTAEFTMLMASRIVEGRFTIRSSTPSAKVAWQVNAVRSDQPPLEVVATVELPNRGYVTPKEQTHEQ